MKTLDGKHITCDGPSCHAQAYMPVALRAALSRVPGGCPASVNGWLFVDTTNKSLHFCPACGMVYLKSLKEAS
jgi:hypothetical protein